MIIWVDADSCPVRIRQIICNAGIRLSIKVKFVANRQIPHPKGENITMIVTDSSNQAADNYIIEHAQNDDIVVTRDILLAKILVDNGTTVINDRGIHFTTENINPILSARNFMYQMQECGIYCEKTSCFGKKEIKQFANLFDALLTKMLNKKTI